MNKVEDEKERIKRENEAVVAKLQQLIKVAYEGSGVIVEIIDKETGEARRSNLFKAKEDITENVVKEIADSVDKGLAAGSVEYANLVKQLAEELSDEQLEDTAYIKSLLCGQLPDWDGEGWYDLLVAVKQKKHQAEHEEKTAEAIFNEMPYFAQAAAETAVVYIIEAARKKELFKGNKAADQQADILWSMFRCMRLDVKDAAKNISRKIEEQGFIWCRRNCLINYIKELREAAWKHGNVIRLRTKELR